MEESAPKRRRVSPRLGSQPDDNNDNNESTTPPDPPPPRSRIPRRPSFASPTKSSLARSNPDILRRRSRSLSPAKVGSNNPPTQSTRDVAGEGSAAQAGGQADRFLERGPARPRSNMSGSTAVESQNLGSPARRMQGTRLSGALASRPRRSGGLPNPRPLPDPDPDEEEFNPFAGRVLNRTPPTGVGPARAPSPEPEPDQEPELPPTPTQKGQADPVVTTPPLGIHDTPSKRRRRTASPSKSSPLKQPPLRPPEFSQKTKDPSKKAVPRQPREESQSRMARKTRSTKGPSGTHEARGIPVPDPNSGLKEARDALQAEVAKLEADLELATGENERIRKAQSLRSGILQPLSTSRREQLLDLLRRHLLPPEKEAKPDAAQQWFDLAMNPTSWLSFGSLDQTQQLLQEKDEDLPPPTSHHPIALSAADELPYLQAFTPFEFSATTNMLPKKNDSDPLLRKHNIVVRSGHPAGLFMAKIEMTVDTNKLQVVELSVPRLDPAAVAELGPFVERITDGGSNTHMNRNISIVTWAMAEWYRIAVERANVWYTLENELGDKDKLVQSVAKLRTRRKKRRRKDADEESSQDADGATIEKSRTVNLSRSALLPHLGKTAYEIPIPDAVEEGASCLRIQWRIDFDWTGEAQSKVGLMIGMPGKWHLGDERGSLAAASKVFARLVQGNEGPMTAVRTVVALLAGDALS